MGYRFVLAVLVLSLVSGCAAFDTDNTPYSGFNPDEVQIPNGLSGPYNGNYEGTMTLDSNTCAGVSDEVGAAIPLKINVVQSESLLGLTFEDETRLAGELSSESKAVFMIKTGATKHVYYLTFSEEKQIDGSCEVIEPDENGMDGDPCASYTVTMSKLGE